MPGALSEFPFSAESSAGAIQPSIIASTSMFFPITFVATAAAATAEEGGLTDDDLLEVWKSSLDPSYYKPILEKTDGGGDEIKAVIAAHGAVARSINSSTQSLYILPWSGQTSDPAHTAELATGFLEFSRVPTQLVPAWVPIVLLAGQFAVDHVALDWSETGPIEVLSGRRYFTTTLVTLGPGDLGPYLYPGRAEKAGASYNLPSVDSIRQPVQAGAGLSNTALSTAAPTADANWLVLAPAPDLLSEAQVGQYVRLSTPASVEGQVRRLIAYLPPSDSTTGGTAVLDTVGVFAANTFVGTLTIGEEILQVSTGARGTLVALSNGHLGIEQFTGAPFAAGAIEGQFSLATATITAVVQACALPVASNVEWLVLDWELDVGLLVRNPEPFSGGRSPVLEELGGERAIYRASGEPTEIYRKRVATAGDVVSPNALLRSVNRILAPYGGRGCLREVGYPKLRGLFCDVEPDGNPDHAFAYDMEPDVRIGDRWKVLLDYTEMRAFFLMGVPMFGLGDFSLYADEDPGSDSTEAYLDGYAATDAALHSAVYSTLVRAKAGGVGFDLYIESDGCV